MILRHLTWGFIYSIRTWKSVTISGVFLCLYAFYVTIINYLKPNSLWRTEFWGMYLAPWLSCCLGHSYPTWVLAPVLLLTPACSCCVAWKAAGGDSSPCPSCGASREALTWAQFTGTGNVGSELTSRRFIFVSVSLHFYWIKINQ